MSPADMTFVRTHLTPAEYVLFGRMPRYDQRHALDVAQLMARHGTNDSAVLAMVLLHDCGKMTDTGAPLGLWWYGVAVILQQRPAWYTAAARWCEPLRRHAEHEHRSVHLAEQYGARPAVCEWLRRLADGHTTPEIDRFEWADNQC
jgi:hypothetical protein